MINFERETPEPYQHLTNKKLYTKTYHAWLQVKDEGLASNYETFDKICKNLLADCTLKLKRWPRCKETWYEIANLRMTVNRSGMVKLDITTGYWMYP